MSDTERTRNDRVRHRSGPRKTEVDTKNAAIGDNGHQVERENGCRTSSGPGNSVGRPRRQMRTSSAPPKAMTNIKQNRNESGEHQVRYQR